MRDFHEHTSNRRILIHAIFEKSLMRSVTASLLISAWVSVPCMVVLDFPSVTRRGIGRLFDEEHA